MHAGVLVNLATQRFHPIIFRPAPRPSEDVCVGRVCRHKSIGHHTEGFGTFDEAVAWIEADERYWPSYSLHEWDGNEVPASIAFFPFQKAVEKPSS